MEDNKRKVVTFTRFQPGEDLEIGTREIKTVEFHKSELNEIPAELLHHHELENMIFYDCRFTQFENLEKLKVFENITKITLKDCHLQTFPDFLTEFQTLNSLNMSENSFMEGSLHSVTNLKNLEALDLSQCRLPTFPQVLCNLKSLKELDIAWNDKIQNLPGTLENLTNLEILKVFACGLLGFPQVLCNLKSLKELNIRGNNKIQNLPGELENLTNLETLNVPKCGLLGFPQVLCNLKSLKELNIGENNKIQNLPGALANLTNLETLDMWDCGLYGFPHVLCNLKSLKKLDIGGNDKIQNLPGALENLTNLETLNAQRCGLLGFPQVLCNLKSLKELYIGWNDKIQNLPGALENLTNLEILKVFACGLLGFPQVLCKLKSLKKLDIDYNDKIQNLPGALENLTNLETLNAERCGLIGFPQVLCKLKSLKELNIGGNDKIQNLPGALENLTNLETLDMWNCGLLGFPQVLCNLKSLKKLDLSHNPRINSLPRGIERCKRLEILDISYCQINELPTALFKMKNLSIVEADRVPIKMLDEDFVKLWLQRPDIFTNCRFQKKVKHGVLQFVKPPHEIVERGPEACMSYYRSLRADNAVNCNVLNVALMGKTGAGKSSLTHSIKEGSSVLVHPSDRTVVVDELELQHEDVLLKIADFGGHDIYELTCPLFLKSRKQVVIVVVKLSEYNESKHDELVTKWLTTAVSHMKTGSICIVASQCDLCSKEEVVEKMGMLKEKIQNWIKEESSFWKTLKQTHTDKGILDNRKFHYFNTSSLDMQGLDNVGEFLFVEGRSNRAVLPKRWIEVYMKMSEETARGTHFITENEYQAMFKECVPSSNRAGLSNLRSNDANTNPSQPSMLENMFHDTQESHLCLQFLHDSRMVLWYGEKHENLRKIIFHDPLFLVSVLQCLFRHDLAEVLKYDHEHFGSYFKSRSKFQEAVTRFIQTGILSPVLLRCIWKELKLDENEFVFNTIVKILTMLDLCYVDDQSPDGMLRLPWFVRDDDMGFLEDLWPGKLPPGTLQYTLTYCFCHRIPGIIYERFCVRLQSHLQKGGFIRMDRRDAVFCEQNRVQVLFQRYPCDSEPCMKIHMRCTFENLFHLQKLCLVLYRDLHNLCSEYSGLCIDCYLLCPHCLLTGLTKPTKRPIESIDEKLLLTWVPCNPLTPGSDQTPAALIFLRLLDTENCENHLTQVIQFCKDVTKPQSLAFEELLQKVSKHVTSEEQLDFLGNKLGLKDHEIRTICYDNKGSINRAGYQVLLEWSKQKIFRQVSETEMKEELRKILRADNIDMGEAASLYF